MSPGKTETQAHFTPGIVEQNLREKQCPGSFANNPFKWPPVHRALSGALNHSSNPRPK
jgi:hypothetical protein